MAEALAENDVQQCCCVHDGSGSGGCLDELSEIDHLTDRHKNADMKNVLSKNGCLKCKLASNGITKLTDQCRDSCCHGVAEQDSSLTQTQSCTSSVISEAHDGETAACSSVDSCSKTESDLSDALVSTSISELSSSDSSRDLLNGIEYVVYESELQMPDIMRLITKDLSEPYSIYTYRYFIHNWPKLCFLAMDGDKCVGAIVCKLDLHKKMVRRGYIAMLAVDKDYRRRKIGSHLVMKAIRAMITDDCDEVVLETEITNKSALLLYENLGFVRDKRLFRYYLNGVDALRLKLWLR